jgi:hypothetical protein
MVMFEKVGGSIDYDQAAQIGLWVAFHLGLQKLALPCGDRSVLARQPMKLADNSYGLGKCCLAKDKS